MSQKHSRQSARKKNQTSVQNKHPALPASPRSAAARMLGQVMQQGKSLSQLLPIYLPAVPQNEQALAQEIAFGSLRYYSYLDAMLAKLLSKPLRKKQRIIHYLLITGLYQLRFLNKPDHAVVAETVNECKRLKEIWAKGLVNAVLRNFIRQRESLVGEFESELVSKQAHPDWLIKRLKQYWPEQWQQILEQNNQRPPMTLRVNRQHQSREDYLSRLQEKGIEATSCQYSDDGITLVKPSPVDELPGFHQGDVSVQDQAAQLAARLLDPQAGERVLDACSAPGGKTAHLIERAPDACVTALDVEAERLTRVHENLSRLKLSAQVMQGDAASPEGWWDGQPFDRILLDAPCSATGVIRRHPDIKWLRRDEDIANLVKLQAQILAALWPLLSPGGILLYATCSVMREENDNQISSFLQQQVDANAIVMDETWGRAMPVGRQILPGEQGMDGFYYALLQKQ